MQSNFVVKVEKSVWLQEKTLILNKNTECPFCAQKEYIDTPRSKLDLSI